MASKVPFSRLGALALSVGLFSAAPIARGEDDVEVFRIYDWSSFETPDADTAADCRSIDRGKGESGWAVARREVADVSELEDPDDQEEGTAFRVFVDYCVHEEGSRQRPVGTMTFKAAELGDLRNIQNWGKRHYSTTAKSNRRTPRPGREHFDAPSFKP